jgi:hypothetical protein
MLFAISRFAVERGDCTYKKGKSKFQENKIEKEKKKRK